jgi:DNA polymerase III epsilon subunit-like protein
LKSNQRPRVKLTKRSQLERSINLLLGLFEGVVADCILSRMEINFLERWLDDHADVRESHPYNELIPCLAAAVFAGKLTGEEKANLTWLCEQMRQTAYCDRTTADMQRLKGMLEGIVADHVITIDEIKGLRDWLEDHQELKTCWPYDEVDSLVTEVLRDGKIDEAEHRLLQEYFTGFAREPDAEADDRTIATAPILAGESIGGMCAVDPQIRFEDSRFCFTGASSRFTRDEMSQFVVERGGEAVNSVSRFVDYLVVGAEGNPAWKFACYGRKVQLAEALRRKGVTLLIVHENDFHDAVASTPKRGEFADHEPPQRPVRTKQVTLDSRLNSREMRNRDFVVLDFETTGLHPQNGDRITEVAAIRVRDGSVVDQYESLVNCGVRLNPPIIELTGIMQEMVDNAPPPDRVMRELVSFLGADLVIAHSATFDEGFFWSECDRLGIASSIEPFFCSMKMARYAYPDMENHKLPHLGRSLGLLSYGRAHRAAADARLTVDLVLEMLRTLDSTDEQVPVETARSA